MQIIPLQALPNQAFSINLDNNQWSFVVKYTNGATAVSVTLNNVLLLENARAVANTLIIPCRYQESGNFLFITQNFQLPNYTQFGTTQQFVYVSAADLAALRARPSLPITAADFNPIAALPLRFAPNYPVVIGHNIMLLEGSGDNILQEGGEIAGDNDMLLEGSV